MPPIDVLANWKTIQAAKQKREEEQKKREQEKPARAARAQRDGAEERKSRTISSIEAAQKIKEIYETLDYIQKKYGIRPIDTKAIRKLKEEGKIPPEDLARLRGIRKYMLDYGMYKLADEYGVAIEGLLKTIREEIPTDEIKYFRKLMGWKSPTLPVADFFWLWKNFKKYKGIDGLLLLSNENVSMQSVTGSIPPEMRTYFGWPVIQCSNKKFAEAVSILREENILPYQTTDGMLSFSQRTGIDTLSTVYAIASSLGLVEKLGWFPVTVTRQKFEEARDKLMNNPKAYEGIPRAKNFSEETGITSPHILYMISLALGLTKTLGWQSLNKKSDFSKL